jgi:PAS domain S-box-containing protein
MSQVQDKEQDGIWIIDAEARTVYANDRMAEILGTTSQEMKGQPSFDYLFPEGIEAARRLFDSKRKGDSAPFQFKL